MPSVTVQEAYDQIVAYIKERGGVYGNWYAGIASDARTRLFTDHKVSEEKGAWIYRTCSDDTAARNVEDDLLKLGCDGESGGGDSSTTQVYAYLKTNSTDP